MEISALETFWVKSKPSLMEKKDASLARSKANKEMAYFEQVDACALLMILPKTQRIPSFCQRTKLSLIVVVDQFWHATGSNRVKKSFLDHSAKHYQDLC